MNDYETANDSRGDDIACPYCNTRANKLLGMDDARRARHLKCRKCDSDYWENQATGMLHIEVDE